jgi:mRNA interferase RelE/StbE
LVWKIEFDPAVDKDLRRLGPQAARRILTFLHERVAALPDPRSLGEALHGPELGRFWKYRIGDYRIVAEIRDRSICIVIVRVGHRREIYRR